MIDNDFERVLLHDMPSEFRAAVRNVGDTAYMCKLWFESFGVPYTAADIVAMAAIVQREELRLEGGSGNVKSAPTLAERVRTAREITEKGVGDSRE